MTVLDENVTIVSKEDFIMKHVSTFPQDTTNHTMSILHDDGVYRHIRFKQPGSNIYMFELVTYPGYLVYSGDMGEFVFSRSHDMFPFFVDHKDKSPSPSPDYWAGKLMAADKEGGYKQFSSAEFIKQFMEGVDETLEHLLEKHMMSVPDSHDARVEWLWYAQQVDRIEEAYELMNGEHGKILDIQICEPSDMDLYEFTPRYLWCCDAIVWGISKYYDHVNKAKDVSQ